MGPISAGERSDPHACYDSKSVVITRGVPMEWLVIVPVDIRPVAETREELPQDAAPSTELMSFTVVAPTRQAAVDRVGSALRKLVRLD